MLQVEETLDYRRGDPFADTADLASNIEALHLYDYKAICPVKELHARVPEETGAVEEVDETDSIGDLEWMEAVANPSRWLQGRPAFYYPTDPRLPWHFSWIDDGMIGGMSAPGERFHYPALVDAGVGLIVNLTEAPISPRGGSDLRTLCQHCDYMQEIYCDDIFDDIRPSDDLQVLFLPMPDGSIPSYSQLRLFNTHARDFIRRGKKVIVHCQAGVGRTGTFLAIYLLEKYRCTPEEALARLRWVRPQSLRFHRTDWAAEPFRVFENEQYNQNLLQERFVYRYWAKFIQGDAIDEGLNKENGNSTDNSIPMDEKEDTDIELQSTSSPTSSTEGSSNSDGGSQPTTPSSTAESDTTSPLSDVAMVLGALVDAELDAKIAAFESYHQSLSTMQEGPTDPAIAASLCYPCRGVLSVGPFPIRKGGVWPSAAEESASDDKLVGDSSTV
ncbi:uncharacterized protein SPPG_00699 [Spizellomyces punctatus DAOM BR117]|uniref:Uncharacterized protein n=1 Tax=Spizellomyces punctatus (strain DAOM BR117) TaxID=645134 RepID=A0A0L0HVW5_SPIPD|nr:uncharacterized protein SPPG_00699 [Spizellomyces punctatus DAOM BR117]KND05019.1 hypothetical protein SPPG_00699 [Spizellomyces punctatus DAOM BR117]|eukprot:XP_016613058.1 hypothetical protein SPPG_00699 [Spizellomyces punctatus DAOM BR117]